jgi:dephospho-CoA kinase
MKGKLIIGLTGPIASGKNEIAKMLGRHGAFVIDADEIGHQIMLPQKKVWHEIVKTFGVKVLNRGGKVSRHKLGRIVFSSKAALRKLDRIMHPEMKSVIGRMIRQSRKKIVIVNAAVLKEMGLLPLVDIVIVVSASKKVRIKRLMKSGFSQSDAVARIRAQAKASNYRRIADIIIENDRSLRDLHKKVKRIISKL